MKVYLKEFANLHFGGDQAKALKWLQLNHKIDTTIRVKKKKRSKR